MAKLIKTTIEIDGTEVKQFYRFSLSQGIFAHHVFNMVCPAEALDGPRAALFSKSKNFIGSTFKIKIETLGMNARPFVFTGLVTQVEASRFSGHTGDITISGFSPTILMDNGPHCNTWEKKAIKNIAADVFGHFPANLLSPQIQPAYGETLAYTVQYKETAWQFLNRIAATYGEWFFYNGEAMVLGTLKTKTASLVYGSNLSAFSMALQLRPGNFQQVSYDYVNNEVYSATPQNIEQKAGLSEMGKYVYAKSDEFFSASPKMYNNTFLTNKKQLEDITNIRAAAQSSNMVRFNGSSTHFGVQLGNTIKISDNYGEYTVIDVSHHCDGQGNYSNDFIAIPASVKVPPVTNYAEPFCETQTAVVTDNHDPKGLGRVRVRFHWMKPDQKTPWLRVSSPHGGGGKGMFFIPEVDEEVIVGFEGNSPTKGYIDGTVYHGRANNSFSNSGNDVKALQTRSGNQIIMNDKDGSITIKDPSENKIVLKGDGTIEITAPKKITLATKEIELNAEVSIKMKAGDGDGVATMALEQAGAKTTITGNTMVEIKSDTEVNMHATTKTSVHGGSQLALSSDTSASLTALTTDINGDTATTVKGGTITLN